MRILIFTLCATIPLAATPIASRLMDTHNANGNELFNYRAPSVYPVEITP